MRRQLLCFMAYCLPLTAMGQSLGVYGQTYPIDEPDMIESIKSTLQKKIDSGDFERYKLQAQETARRHIAEPPPVAGLTHATKHRVFYFDPTIRVKKDVLGPDGAVVVPAGTEVNPLQYSPFTAKWIFIDGRDDAQKKWAKQQLTDMTVRPILVAGRWIDLWREWQRRTYFDQNGELVNRLGIKATPAIVTQDQNGRRIKIEEIHL